MAVRETVFKDSHIVENNLENRLKKFQLIFEGAAQANFHVNLKPFAQSSKKLLKIIRDWKDDNKKAYLAHFSSTNWEALSATLKKQHTRVNCQGCMVHHHLMQCTFPVRKARHGSNRPINITEEGKKIADDVIASAIQTGHQSCGQRSL